MPKAGSTAIQAALWKNFSNRDPVIWLPSDVRASLDGPKVLEQCLKAHPNPRTRRPSELVDVPLAVRCGNLTIASSEEYAFSGPHHLAGDALTGMAVVREPSGWALSAAGENLLRTFPLRPELALTLLSSLDPNDADAQLEAVVSTSIVGYRAQLENVRRGASGRAGSMSSSIDPGSTLWVPPLPPSNGTIALSTVQSLPAWSASRLRLRTPNWRSACFYPRYTISASSPKRQHN